MQTLEAAISTRPSSSYGIQPAMQILGVQYEYSSHEDQHVENVYVEGEMVDPEETYTIATNDYVDANWESLAEGTLVESTDQLLVDVVVKHLEARETIAPSVDETCYVSFASRRTTGPADSSESSGFRDTRPRSGLGTSLGAGASQ